jgi:hypothetical protein
MNAPQLPYSGLRVVEFTHMVMGPTCGMVLADLGAEVIKVEPPAGDSTRNLLGSGAGFFPLFNRNKKSLALDLQTAAGREAVLRLIATADIVSENFKPGTMARLGLDYAALSKLNPRLIYVSHKGFLPGPYDHRTALDEVVQMMGGLAYMTGPPGPAACRQQRQRHHGRHVRRDRRHGRAALQRDRHSTGVGQEVQSALFENNVFLVAQHMMQFAVTGQPADPCPAASGLGRVRRVHCPGRRADLPGGGERHPVGGVLRRLWLCRPGRRSAPGLQQRPGSRARLVDAASARAPGRHSAAELRAASSATACRLPPSHGLRTCLTTRTCGPRGAWHP